MGNAEQATISNLDLSGTTQVIATVQNTGTSPVTITGAYVNGVTVNSAISSTPIAKGTSASFTLTTAGPLALSSGDSVTVKMTTSKGNNLVLTAIKP
jgi:hypothetical protein